MTTASHPAPSVEICDGVCDARFTLASFNAALSDAYNRLPESEHPAFVKHFFGRFGEGPATAPPSSTT